LLVYHLDCLVSLALLSWLQTYERVVENGVSTLSPMVVPSNVSDFILEGDRNPLNLGLSLTVIKNAIHLGLFSRRISILLEVTSNFGGTLITTATGLDIGLHLLLSIADGSSLSHDNFSFSLDHSHSIVDPNEGLHLILDPSLGSVVSGFILKSLMRYTEGSWVIFSCFEAEREGVLPWGDEGAPEVIQDV